MLKTVIQDLIRKQRPYYLLQGNPIKGVDNQYWLVFQHRDAENLLHNIVSFLGIFEKHYTHKLLRIDLNTAHIFEYTPKREGNIPSTTLLRTSKLTVIEQFLQLENAAKEEALLIGSFLELETKLRRRRRFTLPDDINKYHQFITAHLERTKLYRRSTAYFESGVLKLYSEPLQNIVKNEGEIRLLMDWQGFTNNRDLKELQKLHDLEYRTQYIRRTLQEFLAGLEDSSFSSTEILAELVRLGILKIKLVKMEQRRAIYHKKTGILSDRLDNHILHEGSDNFTRAAHSRNAESVTFLYYSDPIDLDAIKESIIEFDEEWQDSELTFDLSQEFLEQIIAERDRRQKLKQPVIESITPDELPSGETTPVEITGSNLERVETIEIPDNDLVKVTIDNKEPERIIGQVEVAPDHPPTSLNKLKVTTNTGVYNTSPEKPVAVSSDLIVPEFSEIEGFKQAVELILAGKHGQPQDFLYWLAMERPHLLRVKESGILDELVDQSILFEHQKSGAQHCLRVMQDFGVAVCADAVGLGKTRLAAAVAKLYRSENGSAKIAIIAAKKLFPNWEREMVELGFRESDYELYNKNLMSRKGGNFISDFNRYGGPDLVIIDEAHEGIRNYKNRIHQMCLQIRSCDRQSERERHFLLLTATPWNNRREDIYNILSPFLSRPEGFKDLDFPPEVASWFERRDAGVENFTDHTNLFRRTYRELFLQRTRQMLREATPDLNLYAKRVAEWLPVVFESNTEQALDQIFTQFETNLYIPSADPIRYLKGSTEQRGLLTNQRRFFLQRAESSMYALSRTIKNFGDRIALVKHRLETVTSDADGLKEFLLLHYEFTAPKKDSFSDLLDMGDDWDEDYFEEEEDEDEQETNEKKEEKRQQLRRSIDIATDDLRDNPIRAKEIYYQIISDCDSDLVQLKQIQKLLADEFVKDHKREQVTQKVREIVSQGHKVLLISTFSDTVIDYYRHMAKDNAISSSGIGMAIGSSKLYYRSDSDQSIAVSPNNAVKKTNQKQGLKRQQIFRLFAPAATCKDPAQRPQAEEEISVLIGSETLSVGQNLQDADYLINIDLPWNPMILEQRIGRIDRPKQHRVENIYIYYANSESQLLRQASRLSNLNKKLVGDLANESGAIPDIDRVDRLGASIYGDTLFDDEILPGYIDFIHSLVKARSLEQGSLQEETYQKQETSRDLYTQNEILHSEELRKLIEELGEDYQANPIAVGHRTNEPEQPTCLVALTLEYFGPNGEPIPEQKQTIYWNDLTQEKDGYGMAVSSAFKTPDSGEVVSAKDILTIAQNLYDRIVNLKQQRSLELEQPETLENINLTSERISKIQKRIMAMDSFPAGIDRQTVKDTLKKLNSGKEQKKVQKLLREYTDGDRSQSNDDEFIKQLVNDTEILNLLNLEGIKPTSLKASLSALLLRIELGGSE
ncbi:helicase [Pleurocapsales cyanobacterium LEGE 06147]|nr:helicase [Pleurocapsales cyanobacterium LEGE 06147]